MAAGAAVKAGNTLPACEWLGEPSFGFVIAGSPVPWARAVPGRSAGQMFTRPRQRAFKKTVGEYCRIAMLQAGFRKPAAGAIILGVRVHLEPPVSWRKDPERWARAQLGWRCTERPDLDNWLKLPMDAMNGLAWTDDEQVAEFAPGTGKYWHPGSPRLEVDVWGDFA